MPKYSIHSKTQLVTCHRALIVIARELIKHVDVRIICGWRPKSEQDYLYAVGMSYKEWPNSKHNNMDDSEPKSHAMDIAQWWNEPPHIRWKDEQGFIYVMGIVMGIGFEKGIALRNGNDWDRDNDLHDQSFMDRGHVELYGRS